MRSPVLLLLLLCHAALAQTYYVKNIPTRDDYTLAADFYSMDTTVAKPVILIQTPYNRTYYRTNIDIPAEAGGLKPPYDSLHYHMVIVDWRGFYGSSSVPAPQGFNRGMDGYDCIEWIKNQSWCNGRVGTWGGSALGGIQFQTLALQHPNHTCAMPMIKVVQSSYEDYYTGGVFRLEHNTALQNLGFTTLEALLSQPVYNTFWQVFATQSDYFDDIQVPVLMVTGWFDHFPGRILADYHKLRQLSPVSVRDKHKMIVGPWTHSEVDMQDIGALTYSGTLNYTNPIALRFFDYYLRDVANGYADEPNFRYYQMGDEQWRTTNDWNAEDNARATYYLHRGGLLSPTPGTAAADTFVYDPHTPTPSFGGQRFNPFNPLVLTGPRNQATIIESRTDVLTFTTAVSSQPLVLRGPLTASLRMRSDRPDTDLNVRLSIVYPDGKSYIVGEGIRRARFRSSYSSPTLLTPGQDYTVPVEIDDIALTVLPGQQLRITICGASNTRFWPNLNNGGDMYVAGDTLPSETILLLGNQSTLSLPIHTDSQTATDGPGHSPQLHLYPNPASTHLTLDYTTHEATTLRIWNLQGQEQYSTPVPAGTHRLQVPVPATPGLYLVQLGSTTRRLVVE